MKIPIQSIYSCGTSVERGNSENGLMKKQQKSSSLKTSYCISILCQRDDCRSLYKIIPSDAIKLQQFFKKKKKTV